MALAISVAPQASGAPCSDYFSSDPKRGDAFDVMSSLAAEAERFDSKRSVMAAYLAGSGCGTLPMVSEGR